MKNRILNAGAIFAALSAAGFKGNIKVPYIKKRAKNYIPAGKRKNVRGPIVKNFWQADQMNALHNAWYLKKFGVRPEAY